MFLWKILQVKLNLNDVNNSNVARDNFIYVSNCLSKILSRKNASPEVTTMIVLRGKTEKKMFEISWLLLSGVLCSVKTMKRQCKALKVCFCL